MKALALTHVFPRSPSDPSAPFLLTWAQALQTAGAAMGVVAPHDAGLPRRHEVDGVPVRRVRYAPDRLELLAYRGEMHQIARRPIGPPLVAGLFTAMVLALRAEVRRQRPDVVHVHWWMPGMVIARLARLRVPVVCTVHGTDLALAVERPALRRVGRWALGAADRVEAVSTATAQGLADVLGVRVAAVNPMPVAPHWLEGPAGDGDGGRAPDPGAGDGRRAQATLLAVGRLVPEKGFAELVEATARLSRPARLRILGEGPEQARLRGLADRLGVALDLAGRVDPAALRAAYEEAAVVVQPSRREGLGLVAAEALLIGRPVVATDSGGVRDVLGDVGLVPPGDVAALAAALDAALDDPGAAARAQERAEVLRERLSGPAAAARTLSGYRAVTAPGGGRTAEGAGSEAGAAVVD